MDPVDARVSLQSQCSAELRSTQHVLCRVFPPPQASNKKAELAASALGLQAVIMFRAFSSQMSGNNSFSREHSDRESSRGSFTLSHQISSPALQPGVQTASA